MLSKFECIASGCQVCLQIFFMMKNNTGTCIKILNIYALENPTDSIILTIVPFEIHSSLKKKG